MIKEGVLLTSQQYHDDCPDISQYYGDAIIFCYCFVVWKHSNINIAHAPLFMTRHSGTGSEEMLCPAPNTFNANIFRLPPIQLGSDQDDERLDIASVGGGGTLYQLDWLRHYTVHYNMLGNDHCYSWSCQLMFIFQFAQHTTLDRFQESPLHKSLNECNYHQDVCIIARKRDAEKNSIAK